MTDPSPPPDAGDIMTVVHEAVGGIELEPAEKREIWRFTQRELPYLWSQRTSYFILGSYRDPYIRRLRAVQNELTKQLGAYPFIMGDLLEIPTDRLNTFDIMFSLLATYSDYIIGVFEKPLLNSLMRLLVRPNKRSPSAVLPRIKEKASRFSAVANRNAICWHTRSRRLLGTGMNPTTPPQPTARRHG